MTSTRGPCSLLEGSTTNPADGRLAPSVSTSGRATGDRRLPWPPDQCHRKPIDYRLAFVVTPLHTEAVRPAWGFGTSRDIRRVIPTRQMQNEACRTRVI